MRNFIANWTIARPEPVSPFATASPGKKGSKNAFSSAVPIFIHPKALTYPVVVGLVKGAWAAVSILPVPWLGTYWFPFIASMGLGLLIAVCSLAELKVKGLQWLLGFGVGLINSLLIFGAVMGITGKH